MRRFAGRFRFEAAVVEEATFRLLVTGAATFGPLTAFVFAARPAGFFARAGGPTSTGFSTVLTNVARPVRFLPEAAVTGIGGAALAGSAGFVAIDFVARFRERGAAFNMAFGFAGVATGEATTTTV